MLAGGETAADITADYFAQRRYAGSKDRRAIINRFYEVLRAEARLCWWLNRCRADETTPGARERIIAGLALIDELEPASIVQLFSGDGHAPAPLTAREHAIADALSGEPLTHEDMPSAVAAEIPDWVEDLMRQDAAIDAAVQIAALNQSAPLDLRVNTLKTNRDAAIAALDGEGYTATPTPWSPLGLRLDNRVRIKASKAFRAGLVEVQDEGSQLAAKLVDARPGMTVIDFCAGAGGKTLALAADMQNNGTLRACDISEARLRRMRERLRRAGVTIVTEQVLAVETAPEPDPWIATNAATADRVLVDAPCTGTGTWRRHPDARWRLSPDDLNTYCHDQSMILQQAARLVRPGGRLVYVTCSLLPAENEAQATQFQISNPAFHPLDTRDVWASVHGGDMPPGRNDHWLRLSPATSYTDGFFCAIFERRAD